MFSTSKLRMSGLYSGLDTETLIRQIMTAESQKYNKLFAVKARAEWQKTAYSDLTNSLRKFREEWMSTLSDKVNMLSKNSYKTFSVSYTNEKQSAVTIEATSGASSGTHVISEISSLATGAKAVSKTGISGKTTGFSNLNTKLSDAFGNTSVYNEFQINGVNFSFGSDATIQEVISKVNSSKAGVTMSYSQLTDQFTIESKTTGQNSALVIENIAGNLFGINGVLGFDSGSAGVTSARADGKSIQAQGFTALGLTRTLDNLNSRTSVKGVNGKINFTIEGPNGAQEFAFDSKTASLQDIMDAVNGANLGVTMAYDAVSGAFSFSSAGDAPFTISNQVGNLFGEGNGDGVLGIKTGTYNIPRVAVSERVDGKSLHKDDYAQLNLTSALEALNSRLGVNGSPSTVGFTITGPDGTKDFTFDVNNTSLRDIMDAVNDAELGVTMSYHALGTFSIVADDGTSPFEISSQVGNLFGEAGSDGVLGIQLGTYAGSIGASSARLDGESLHDDDSTGLDLESALSALNSRDAVESTPSQVGFTVTSPGGTQDFLFDVKTTSLQDIMDAVNGAGLGVTMAYDAAAGAFSFTSTGDAPFEISDQTGNLFGSGNSDGVLGIKLGEYNVLKTAESDRGDGKSIHKDGSTELDLTNTLSALNSRIAIKGTDSQVGFTITGSGGSQEFLFDVKTTTLEDIMNAVNEADLGVVMSHNDSNGSISFMSADGSAFTISDQIGNLFSEGEGDNATEGVFGIQLGTYGVSNRFVKAEAGQNAKLTIDNVEVERTTNSFTIDGISYTLNKTFTDSAEAVEFTLKQDIDTAFKNIKEFVGAINSTLVSLYNSYYEKKVRGFDPLTDEQKSDLTEKEIELWETEAKKGLMYRDTYIGALMDEIRGLFSTNLAGQGLLSDIGITTSQYKAGEPVQLQIDETKLRKALSEDPDKVMNMFSATSTSTDAKTKAAESGFAVRFSDAMVKFTTNVNSIAQQALDRSVSDYTTRLKNELARLEKIEERYWKKYSALESALAAMQSQSDYVTQLFSGMTQNN